MSKLNIERWNVAEDGEITAENMRNKLGKQGYTCSQYTFGPGTKFSDHTHDVTKKDAIVTGQFLFRMQGEEVILRPGDMIEVPRGTVHYAEVIGKESVVFFDSSK